MGVSEMLKDMNKSYNVVAVALQHFVYFGCIEVKLLTGRNNNVLYLDTIISSDSGQGLASRTIDEICMYADRHKVILWLEVKPFPTYDGGIPKLNEIELVQWYTRHGFETEEFISPHGNRAGMGSFIDMIRQPK